jgi:hypothetical protein
VKQLHGVSRESPPDQRQIAAAHSMLAQNI